MLNKKEEKSNSESRGGMCAVLKTVCEEGFMFIYLLISCCYSFGVKPYPTWVRKAEMALKWRRTIGKEEPKLENSNRVTGSLFRA